MSNVKRNIVANYLGQGWTALMGIVFVPYYIRYLGLESYGLIGVFVTLQAWFSLLDLGMTPTLGREMARYTGGVHGERTIRDVVRTLETVCWCMATVILGLMWLGARWLASHWLNARGLAIDAVIASLELMGVVIALRLVEGLYRGGIGGLQRQVWLNGAGAVLATLRHGGAVVVLAWYSATLQAFFIWQAVISLLTVLILARKCHASLPGGSAGRFSIAAMVSTGRFAAGMFATTLLSLLLTQVDKLLLPKLLPLEVFGYYALATQVAATLGFLSSPVAQAAYPRLTEIHTQGDQVRLAQAFHRAAQLVAATSGTAAALLICFGQELLTLWTRDAHLAAETYPLMALLAVGNLLNAIMIIPYMLQLAAGWVGLAVRINIVAVTVLVPLLYWAAVRYGSIGAAFSWMLLNVAYVVVVAHFMHRRILPAEKTVWYRQDVVAPLAAVFATAGLLHLLHPHAGGAWLEIAWIAVCTVVVAGAAVAATATVRSELAAVLRSWWYRR